MEYRQRLNLIDTADVYSAGVGEEIIAKLRAQPARPDPAARRGRARALDEISAPPLLYPYRHQAKTASERLSDADLALLAPHVG
jgi:hypothetical protein